MFGSCGSNTKCGIGEISLNKITLIRTQKGVSFIEGQALDGADLTSTLVLTNVKLLRGISFSHKRDLSIINFDRRSTVSSVDEQFSPESLSLQINYLSDVDSVKRFVRDKNSTYIAKMEFSNKTLLCEVILQSDTVDTYTILDKWSLDFLRTSMYYTTTEYTLTDGKALVTNGGDVYGALQFWATPEMQYTNPIEIKFLSPLSPYQQILPFNSFSIPYSAFIPGDDDTFKYSSVPGDMYMIRRRGGGDLVDVTGSRSFATKGFVEIPYGSSTLQLTELTGLGAEDLVVTVYEYYYNI